MSVHLFWRRVNPDAVQGLDPPELRQLVPYFDNRFHEETKARITVAVTDNGVLIGELLRLGAGEGPDSEAAWLAIDGADGLGGDHMVGLLTPEEVAKVAEFLSRAQPAAWVQQFQPDLAEAWEKGSRHPFDDDSAHRVVEDTEKVTQLFRLAAAEGEAVIVAMSA